MGFLDKVGSFLKREANDLGDAAESVKDKLDVELTKREESLEMSQSDKITALEQQAAANEERLDAIGDKALGESALADAVAEVEASTPSGEFGKVTHTVLSDGTVETGDETQTGEVSEADADSHSPQGDQVVAEPVQVWTSGTAADPADETADREAAGETADTGDVADEEPAAPGAGVKQGPDYEKVPAQIRYEQARAAADHLLEELRSELKDQGEI